jgi:hypothetical protein
MAPRSSWKGYLKLSLVSCPIALYPASSSSERVSFNRINKKTGNRLKQHLVDAETGETVEKEDIGAATRLERGNTFRSRTRKSTRSGSKAPAPSRLILSFLELRSTTATSIARITSRLLTRSDRRHLPSSAMRSATREWSL